MDGSSTCSRLLYLSVLHTPNQFFVFPSPYYCRFSSIVGPGDTVSVTGEFDDQGDCVVDHDSNLVIIHPELLISGTRVSTTWHVLNF
jgi:acyl dehydratase